jgi:hypothetical protein
VTNSLNLVGQPIMARTSARKGRIQEQYNALSCIIFSTTVLLSLHTSIIIIIIISVTLYSSSFSLFGFFLVLLHDLIEISIISRQCY